MTYEGIRLKVNKYRRRIFANLRKRRLENTDFTIISNNCWGGMIYESYAIKKNSPTVGAFFMATDYIKFVSNMKDYISCELKFIDPENSRYKSILKKDKRFGQYPIGKLNDVEIMFLHYENEKDAKEKWERRCKRINWNKLIFKFNDQNLCEEKDVLAFSKLPYKNKLFFTIKDWPVEKWDGYCRIKQRTKDDCVTASHEPFGINQYINITALINRL